MQAHVTLREQALGERRSALEKAYEQADLLHGHASDLTDKIHATEYVIQVTQSVADGE